MLYWVIYDITRDNARNKVAKACKRAGLHRMQQSVFLGRVKKKTLLRLRTDFNRIVNWRTDKVFFVPMNEQEYKNVLRTGAKRQTSLLPYPGQAHFY